VAGLDQDQLLLPDPAPPPRSPRRHHAM
jgi:hypothetical protein